MPMRGIRRPGCWACAARGHAAAAPPSRVMKSRRFIVVICTVGPEPRSIKTGKTVERRAGATICAAVEPYPEAASDSTSGLPNDQNHVRRSFLDAERGWLFLAISYEFAERLSRAGLHDVREAPAV